MGQLAHDDRECQSKGKPRSTGRETNPARLPSRASASAANSSPASRVSAVTLAFIACAPLPPARLASAAARMAADEDVGETTANRLRPSRA
jgi:hypothetical protein